MEKTDNQLISLDAVELRGCHRVPLDGWIRTGDTDGADRVSALDRLVARMEISRSYPFPVFSFVLLWADLIGLAAVAEGTGSIPMLPACFCGAAWLLVVGLEFGRDMWVQRHRHASPRWLRAVEAAVGNDVVVHALADLIRRHRHDPDYAVTRSDLRRAVQTVRARRRKAAYREEGFRLFEESMSTDAQSSVVQSGAGRRRSIDGEATVMAFTRSETFRK